MTPADGDGGFELPQMPRPTGRGPGDRDADDRTPDLTPAMPLPPSEDDVVTVHDRPHAHRNRVLIAAAVAAVVVIAVVVAGLVWGPGSPLTQPSPSAGPTSGSASPPGPIALPERFGSFAVKPTTQTQGPIDSADDLVVTSATYTQNGVDSVLLIAAAPAEDMRSFLLSLGASELHEVEGGWCATYQEVDVCGVVTETRAYAVSPLAEQTEAELITIAREASTTPV